MKTASAHIISSKPVSLLGAAKFLSNFVEYDNGASHAVSTYLRRTSDAFNELSEFHKKLMSSGPNRKSNSSKASSGISTSHNKPSPVSAWSSEGEEVTEKRKEKNRRREVDGDQSVSIRDIRVDGNKSVMRHAHGEASGNDFEGNLANGVEDNFEAVAEKKKRKEQHKRMDQDDESAEYGGESRYSVSKGSEGIGDDLSEKSREKKKIKKKRKGEEGDDSLLENDLRTVKKDVSEGKCENDAFIADDLSEKSSKKKRNKKKKKGEEGDDGLLPNGVSTEEKEISDGKSGSAEGKKENSKKWKNEGTRMSIEVDGSVEHREKKTKIRVGEDQDL